MQSPSAARQSGVILKAVEAFEASLLTELTAAEVQYLTPHKTRIVKSIEWLAPYVREDTRMLDLGGGMFPHIFTKVFPDICGEHTNTDLRYPLKTPSEQYDIIINTELLEHLKDRVESNVEHFDLSGFHSLLSESYRILKTGGIMFVTTPNASSIGILYRQLMGWPPHYYYPHVREYTVHELRQFLEEHLFSIERIETLDVYDDLPEDRSAAISNMLAENGYNTELRGDCTFVIARKRVVYEDN
jgi:predicted SAM-dependent methyltransferase